MDIGVAKPSVEELNLVHHYFINSHSIHQQVNAGTYEEYALRSAHEIFAENSIAVMVGGTGLYINAFCNGIDAIPNVPESIRNQIICSYNQNGLEWLQMEVKTKDPAFWKIAEQANPHRLMRALEIIEATGSSILTFRNGEKKQRPFKIVKLGLELNKEQLHHNINTRVDKMIDAGLVQEVESLLQYKNLNALQTVGYRELFDYFGGTIQLQQAIEKIKTNTRQYAKRQMTWFKKDASVQWLHATEEFDYNTLHSMLQLA